jgi:hypothetical protein
MVEVARLDQLLDVVGHVGAEIVAPRAQLRGRQFLAADIEEQQTLRARQLQHAAAIELVLDEIEQAAVQPLDEVEGFAVAAPTAGSSVRGTGRASRRVTPEAESPGRGAEAARAPAGTVLFMGRLVVVRPVDPAP